MLINKIERERERERERGDQGCGRALKEGEDMEKL